MAKRGAEMQLSKEGGFQGDGANQLSAEETPQRASAAQMAKRKLKPLKGRTRPAGSTSSSFPGASQPAPGGVGSNPFSSSTFAPAPASANNGFSFSFGGPPSTAFNAPANDAMDTSVSPQKQPAPASNNLFAQSASSAMPSSGSNLFASFSKPDSGNIFSQSTSSSNPFQFGAATSTAPPASTSSQPAQNLFASATQNKQASLAPPSSSSPFNFGGLSQGQNKTTPEPANKATSQSTFNFSFGANTANASQPAPAFSFGASAPAKDAQEASSALTTSSAPSTSQPAPAFSFNAPSTNKDAPPEAPKPFSSSTASQPTSNFTFGATNASKDSGPSTSPFSFGAPSSSKLAASSAADQPSSSISQQATSSNLFAAKPSFPPSLPESSSDSNAASSAPSNPFNFATSTSTRSTTAFSPTTPAKTTQPTPSLFGSTTPAPSFTPTKEPDAQQEIGNNAKSASTISTSDSNLFKASASTSGISTATNLFGNMTPKPSGGANNLFSSPKPENTPAQSSAEKSGSTEHPSKSASGQSSSSNIFAAAAASKPSNENSEAPVAKSAQPAPSNGSGEHAASREFEEDVYEDPGQTWLELNLWWKKKVAAADLGEDFWRHCHFYLERRRTIRKCLGIAKSDDLLEEGEPHIERNSHDKPRQNGTAAAASPKILQQAAGQDAPSTGAAGSQTANIFSSIVNKSSQSSPQNAANGSRAPAARASTSNAFGTSTSSAFDASTSRTPVKAATPLGDSTSTTPSGSPVKRNLFSAQTPSKSGSSGQLGNAETPKSFDTGVAKRKSGAISADDAGDATKESAQEKRQKTDTNGGLQPPSSGLFGAPSRSPTPGSSANNGSVLNSGAASPNPNNPFSHLSQDESTGRDDDDDDDEEDDDGEVDDEEAGSSTPTQDPKTGSSLFGRITKDDSGKAMFGTPPAKNEAKGTNIFGFAQTGPVNKTWSGDSESPIKFSTPQPASSATDAKPFNPFAGLAQTTAAPSSGSTSTPFKFNPTPDTTSDSGSVLGTASGSRAATPGLPSTGASEAEDDETPAPVDTESIKLRTALTDEDKANYEILFDTDDKAVSTMRLVDKTEEELAADPKKQPKKWVVMNKGPLRVLKHRETGAGSILLKSEPMGRAVINSRLQANLMYKRAKPRFAMLSLPLEAGKLSSVYIKFDDDADCTKFVDVCESNKS